MGVCPRQDTVVEDDGGKVSTGNKGKVPGPELPQTSIHMAIVKQYSQRTLSTDQILCILLSNFLVLLVTLPKNQNHFHIFYIVLTWLASLPASSIF